MAHANPEFAHGLMRPERGPVAHQVEGPPTLAALRERIRAIGNAIDLGLNVSENDRRAYSLWLASVKQTRMDDAQSREINLAVGDGKAMHGGHARGERFTEPKRRIPLNVQAGREKLDCRGYPT